MSGGHQVSAMSYREWLVGIAMQALIAAHPSAERHEIARSAVAQADAVIAAVKS